MEIVHPDGTLAADQIVWDEIPEDSYNNEGTFSVSGTVKGTELKAIANVMVVSGKKVNAALSATASAIVNTPEDLGGVAGLNDGYEPAGSRDTSHGVWHNWLGGNQSGCMGRVRLGQGNRYLPVRCILLYRWKLCT